MPGLDSLCGVWNTKVVRGRPREAEAQELLKKIADQVKPICVVHKWNVRLLEEFVPPNAGLLGMNVNRQKIFIRLRPASDQGSFYPYEALLYTMLHELVHMEIGPHNAKFYKMLDELRDECEKLIREGITGRNMPFAGDGQSLGGARAPVDARAAALKAAQRRQRQQGIMGGGQRLGGHAVSAGSTAQRAAAAAEWRQAVSRGCAATQGGSSSQAHGGCTGHGPDDDSRVQADGNDNFWECDLCTLHNNASLRACGACGTARPPGVTTTTAATRGRSLQGSSDSTGIESTSSGSGAVRGVRDTGKGPAPESSKRAPSMGETAIRRPNPSRAHRTSGDRGSANPDGDSARNVGGQPARSTWICRACPFSFPNAAERRTCESCGARRVEGDAVAGGAAGGAGGVDDRAAGGASRRRVRPKEDLETVSPWACAACTVVNPGIFLACGTCQALRVSDFVGSTSREASPPSIGGGENVGSMAPFDQMKWEDDSFFASTGSQAGGARGGCVGRGAGNDSGTPPRVCSMCTLRNPAEAVACAACGIPLAESAAAGAGSGIIATPSFDDARDADRERRRPHGEISTRDQRGSTSSNAQPDLIDLS